VATQIQSDRLERLTNLVLALLHTNRPLPLREIATTVAGYPDEPTALRQAFERDKKVLRQNGIPLTMERLRGTDSQVGYRILPEHYYLPDLALTADEQLALSFALAAVRLEGGGPARGALGKLGLPEVPDLPPVAVFPSLPALGILQDAVRRRSAVTFGYRGRAREVEGYGLCFRSGAWYLVGRDLGAGRSAAGDGRGDLRTFRVDRIEGDVVAGSSRSYEVPEGLDLRELVRFVPWQSGGEDTTEVVVDVDAPEARAALDLAGAGAEEPRPVGAGPGVRLRVKVGDEEAFVSWLVGLGDAAVLVSPERLRERVVDRLRQLAGPGPGPGAGTGAGARAR
jgi:proteasome accessory factor B